LSWRDEIGTVLETWIVALGGEHGRERWQRVGTARPTGEPGSYAVDIRGSDLTADQADNLRLAGSEERSVWDGFPVMGVTVDGELLRVRVAEFAAPSEPYLWRLRQQPTFLVTALRDGLAALADAGLANLLARGEVGGVRAAVTPPPLLPAQQGAYQACLGSGLWLVWGPPGTGKTRVLRAAIGDLIADGKRVLLVSGTNIAVDNALLGVVREHRHRYGEVVRVGPPQLREIADDPQICLPLMVQARLAETEERRRAAALDLLEMDRRSERLRSLQAKLAGFDIAAYETAAALLADPGHTVTETSNALAECELLAEEGLREIENGRNRLNAAALFAAEAAPARKLWVQIAKEEADLAQVEEAARQAEARGLVAENRCAAAEERIAALQQPGRKVRRRDRGALREAQRRLEEARPEYDRRRADATRARSIADASRHDTEASISDLISRAELNRDEIQRRDAAVAQAKARLDELAQTQFVTQNRLANLRSAYSAVQEADELVTACARRGWPDIHAQATVLRSEVAQDNARRRELEERHSELQQQYENLARDAQGEIIRAAHLVATTLARFRTTKAVLEGPYDIVLVDEAGAATLPEILLAVAKASQCAVLLGDFMQLGPVLPTLEHSDRADIRRWLITDVFRHCGITTPAEALHHRSCLVLDTQHRFGPHVMDLANLLAYDGLLKPGDDVRSHTAEDPEIVLIDTDGLHELTQVHRVSRNSGWWAAGLLLARALVEFHSENGETTGVVTPYTTQAEATLEALRDVEPGGHPLAEVGTAHRFQGREFPIVVFDTVEPLHDGGLWIGQASRLPGSTPWQQNGVRLFNVATTRVQHRLYVIASRGRIRNAKPGTALGHFGVLLGGRKVRSVPATGLVAPLDFEAANLGPEGRRLAEVLARHVEITDIHDERSFYDQFARLISEAQSSIWLWSAWAATRVYKLLPLLKAAIERGVRVTVFVRDPSDSLQKKTHFAEALAALRTIVPDVVEVHATHEKAVIIDEHTVMFGSLNVLSQQRSREVMVTMRGHHWARKLLLHLHAEEFSRPPRCEACDGQEVDLRRRNNGSWYWHCHSNACSQHGTGKYKGWTRDVILRRSRN